MGYRDHADNEQRYGDALVERFNESPIKMDADRRSTVTSKVTEASGGEQKQVALSCWKCELSLLPIETGYSPAPALDPE